ncbi:MAG: MoaD/ThiS family protein [Flavobacteriaceae bacterium]|nr:MoaD/ThiS family protein [Flavobacteriaceae bacterium]
MNIQLLLFGIIRDIVGENKLDLTISKGTTVEKLKRQLATTYFELSNYDYSVAINEAYAKADMELKNNDTVALIPPVSGG